MPADFVEADLNREIGTLRELLGETRARFHQRKTPGASSEDLIDLDREIRAAFGHPPSAELQAEVRHLTARLRALDPR